MPDILAIIFDNFILFLFNHWCLFDTTNSILKGYFFCLAGAVLRNANTFSKTGLSPADTTLQYKLGQTNSHCLPTLLLLGPLLEYNLGSAKINYVWLFQNEAAGPDKRDLYTTANRWLIPLLRLWKFCFPFAICQADRILKSLFYSLSHNSANRFSVMIGRCLHHCTGCKEKFSRSFSPIRYRKRPSEAQPDMLIS